MAQGRSNTPLIVAGVVAAAGVGLLLVRQVAAQQQPPAVEGLKSSGLPTIQ